MKTLKALRVCAWNSFRVHEIGEGSYPGLKQPWASSGQRLRRTFAAVDQTCIAS